MIPFLTELGINLKNLFILLFLIYNFYNLYALIIIENMYILRKPFLRLRPRLDITFMPRNFLFSIVY